MAAEVAVVFAHATGRTLVLAPDSVLYLLMMNKNHKKNKSNLDDFYEFRRILDGIIGSLKLFFIYKNVIFNLLFI